MLVSCVKEVTWQCCCCCHQLHVASCNGYLRVLEFLLNHGAIIGALDNDGWQPLHCAVCWGQVCKLTFHFTVHR